MNAHELPVSIVLPARNAAAPDALPALPREPLIVSVARDGPRPEIRAALLAMGFVEGKDYLCAA